MAEKYTPKQMIDALTASNGVKSHAAGALGCSISTVSRYIKAYPEVKTAFDKTKKASGEKFTPKQVAKIIQESKGILALAARRLGCTRSTVHRYVNTYPEVKDAYQESNETNIDIVENKLMILIDGGNVASTIFFLKTKAKHRGYVERQERRNIDMDVSQLTDEQLERLARGEDPLVVFSSSGQG